MIPSYFHFNRLSPLGDYEIEEVFPGIKSSFYVNEIFRFRVPKDIFVRIDNMTHEMRVLDENGTILIGRSYLLNADPTYLFLDIHHELVHLRQHLDHIGLYDDGFEYVDRPTEIEAYKIVVNIAEKIGMNKSEICNYLKVDWIDPIQHKRLALSVGIYIDGDDLGRS
jgi:hypothetical protein